MTAYPWTTGSVVQRWGVVSLSVLSLLCLSLLLISPWG